MQSDLNERGRSKESSKRNPAAAPGAGPLGFARFREGVRNGDALGVKRCATDSDEPFASIVVGPMRRVFPLADNA